MSESQAVIVERLGKEFCGSCSWVDDFLRRNTHKLVMDIRKIHRISYSVKSCSRSGDVLVLDVLFGKKKLVTVEIDSKSRGWFLKES